MKFEKFLIKQRDEQAKVYDSWYEKTHPHFEEEVNWIIKYLNPKKDERILDAGCGTGHMTERIAPLCKSIFGIDYSPISVKIFNKKGIGEARVHNLTKPIDMEKFDKVVSCQVIQHIPTRELKIKALKNIKEVLKSKGIFVCELQDWTSLKRRLQRIKTRIGGGKTLKEETNGFYVYRFSPREFVGLLKEAGFKENKIYRKEGYFLTVSR